MSDLHIICISFGMIHFSLHIICISFELIIILTLFGFIDISSWPAACIHGDKSQGERDRVLRGMSATLKSVFQIVSLKGLFALFRLIAVRQSRLSSSNPAKPRSRANYSVWLFFLPRLFSPSHPSIFQSSENPTSWFWLPPMLHLED